MAGIISPSMPVWVVENTTGGQPRVLQPQRGARQGAALRRQRPRGHRPPALDRRATSRRRCARPSAARRDRAQAADGAGAAHGRRGAQPQRRGDRAALQAARAGAARRRRAARAMPRRRSSFIAGNDHFFLNLSMAACKAMLDAAAGVPGSSMVTAMARNGVNFGIRLSRHRRSLVRGAAPIRSTASTSPATRVADAAADLGDSRSPRPPASAASRWPRRRRSCKFVGGTPADALHHSLRDARDHARRQPVVHAARARLRRGTPPASTRARWSTRGMLPVINTGIAHREAGVGQIGAGITDGADGVLQRRPSRRSRDSIARADEERDMTKPDSPSSRSAATR